MNSIGMRDANDQNKRTNNTKKKKEEGRADSKEDTKLLIKRTITNALVDSLG